MANIRIWSFKMDFSQQWRPSLIAAALSIVLMGCGSSDSDNPEVDTPEITPPDTSTPTTPDTGTPATNFDHQIAGVAAYQGALVGATICADLNMNQACETDEPSAMTDSEGAYQIDWQSEVETPEYYLLANWVAASSTSNKKPQVMQLRFKGATQPKQLNTIINAAGLGTLVASSEYGGAINLLTNIKFNRKVEIQKSELEESQKTALLTEVDTLLARLFALQPSNLYQVTPANSVSDDFIITEALYNYVEQVLAGQIPALLALENVLDVSFDDLKALLEDSEFSLEEFIDSDPLAARILISNAAISLGYTESHIDHRIMGEHDWDILLGNIISETGFKNTFTLSSNVGMSSFSLHNSADTKQLFGFLVDDVVTAFEMNITSNDYEWPTQCWNTTSESWMTEDQTSPDFTKPTPYFDGNTYVTYYDNTPVEIHFISQKLLKTDEEWDAIINSTPQALALNDISWPEVSYRMEMQLTENVMCREVDNYDIINLPEYSQLEQINTADIVDLFFDFDDSQLVITNDVNNTISVEDGLGTPLEVYHWELLDSPNGMPMIEITTVPLEQANAGLIDHRNYLIEDFLDGKIATQFDLYKATIDESTQLPLMLTYDEDTYEFTDVLYQHLLGLISTQP